MFSFIWHTKEADQVPSFRSEFDVCYILPLFWIEHCVECSAPVCYSTCRIFKPRSDGRCIRFEKGVAPYEFENGVIGGQIILGRWAKIQARLPVKLHCISFDKILRLQKRINRVGLFFEKLLKHIAWNKHRPSKVIESVGVVYTQKHTFQGDVKDVDGFLATIYNHQDREQKFLFEIEHDGRIDYKTQILLKPGWNERFILSSEMRMDGVRSPHVRLYLDNNDTGMFTFMYLDFVSLADMTVRKPAEKVKCVAWDLDNTLWDGVVGDADDGNVKPNPKVINVIEQLDKRGILQTIVSKNNYDIAWRKVEEIGISDFFLYPAINWGRKSRNLIEIAKELNINIDSFALIDDSEFERKEVEKALPQVRAYDVKSIDSLLSLPEFDVPVTEESSKRRQSYLTEYERKRILASFGDDDDRFLIDCRMRMTIFRPEFHEERERCLELLQRSHQYNISKEKRTEDEYYQLYQREDVSLYGLRVSDKYGDYGIVGFISIFDDDNTHRLHDFVMSCRVAQKKIERAFFNWLIKQYPDGDTLEVDVMKTDRNIPLRDELVKMPFGVLSESADKICFIYHKGKDVFIDDDIIEVIRK